ncbi:hypothetical protein M885DRAFT_537370 [Pelagophyceae sp. CCMP2097]|nr:hypothetical protein M885DRAFT_537370 [Pelagophyceae sp. CCMP2097]
MAHMGQDVGVSLRLLQTGLVPPCSTHTVLDGALYATNQRKQVRYVEHALAGAPVARAYRIVIHKGDTAPLGYAAPAAAVRASSPAARRADAATRAAEATKRTADEFMRARDFDAARLTYEAALAAVTRGAGADGATDAENAARGAEARIRLGLASCLLRLALPAAAEAHCDGVLRGAPTAAHAQAAHFNRALARSMQGRVTEARADLAKCEQTPTVVATLVKLDKLDAPAPAEVPDAPAEEPDAPGAPAEEPDAPAEEPDAPGAPAPPAGQPDAPDAP